MLNIDVPVDNRE